MENARTADILLETTRATKVSDQTRDVRLGRVQLSSLCKRSMKIKSKISNHLSIEARTKRLEDQRRSKNLRLLPKIVRRPTFPNYASSDEDSEDTLDTSLTTKRKNQYSSKCNLCYEMKSWCGFPHFDVHNTVPLTEYELRVRERARKRMGKGFIWLEGKGERLRLKRWNTRRVVYKPEAALVIQKFCRRFFVQLFCSKVYRKFCRKSHFSHHVIREAMSSALLRKQFFATQIQKVVRGKIGRNVILAMRVTTIQRHVRGHLGRLRILRLRSSIARLQGKIDTSLVLQIMSGTNLVAADRNGFSDPYCVVTANGVVMGKTKKKEKTLNPVWDNEVFSISISKSKTIPLSGVGGIWHFKKAPNESVTTLEMLSRIQNNKIKPTDEIRHAMMPKHLFLPITSLEDFPTEFALRANQARPWEVKKSQFMKKKPKKLPKKKVQSISCDSTISEKVRVTFGSAAKLMRADGIFGKSDPFVELLLNGQCIARSKVIKKKLDPQWNESVDVYIPKETIDGTGILEMKFVVYDYDFAGTNDFLGQVVLCNRQKINDLLSAGELVTLPLKDKVDKKKSKVSGSLTFGITRLEEDLQEGTQDETTAIIKRPVEEDPGAGASDTIKKKDHKLVASDTSKYSISGKWFFKDPRNIDHIHGPMSLSKLLFKVHSRSVHTEEISNLLVRHESVDFYLPVGQEDRFPYGWFCRAKDKQIGHKCFLEVEVMDKDIMSSTSLGKASISSNNIEKFIHQVFMDNYSSISKNKPECTFKSNMKEIKLQLESNEKTGNASGHISITNAVKYQWNK